MTTERLKRLIEARANAWEHQKALLEEIDARGDGPTEEERESLARQDADIEQRDAQIDAEIKREQREADAEAVRAEYRVGEPPSQDDRPDEADLVRSIASGERRSVELRLTPSERRAYAGLSVGTDSAGGDTVPTSFVGRLYQHMIEVSAIRQTNVTVLTTDSGEELQVPKTAGFSSATLTAEAATLTESEPSFGQVTLNAYKYGVLMQITSELLQDSAFDLVGFLAQQAGRAIGNQSGADFV
ncbi:MAG TPA: phage major capsid protein, partial [Nocardioidaceae bacterium]|nr:phage major capsid protein [Nocardioidaceae bacterium]